MTFLPQFKSKYRGNQIKEDIFRFLLIIWSRALADCFRFQQVSVVIITILRALVLSAAEKPENYFYTRFYTDISSFEKSEFQMFWCFTGVANLPIEKVCIIKNFEEANFSDFKRLVMTLKINPQKYNWPQKTCKPLKNTFPSSNWSVIMMRIEQSEVNVKVFVTTFRVFLTRRGTVTNL